ncbi:MFS transporter [Pikeienuella piscinae]|uniref:MFS transporter n=1 Tax=Pikeienuella piscinae TaxID=2748098 RepID=A0A7L5BV07_9RHOB|nr:MFS transporter [Pikeienuella piscinae]QIE54287.1 MFS transporter [Pikeienuella piscinae]
MSGRERRAVWGWMFYDWASQPFHTLILTFIFAPYFAASVADSPARGQEIWGYAVAGGSVLIALLAPVLGAVADASGPRRPWIIVFSACYMVGTAGLWFASPGLPDPALILGFFILGLVGVEFTTVFTNSLLPDLGPKEEIGRISGSGWAMGYWGGLASLVIVLGFIVPGPDGDATLLGIQPAFGLKPALGEGPRATGPLSAIWYFVFMIPFALWTPDAARKPRAAGAVAAGLGQLRATLRSLPRDRSLFSYLASSMFYRDALNGLYVFGGIYAAGVLGWETFQLGLFGIIAALAGAVGAWLGGRADRRLGPKPVICFAIAALMLVSIVTITTGPGEVMFIPVGSAAAPSGLPTMVFYLCGAVIGAAGGSLQAASRTMLVRQAREGRMAEAFGIYALAGKATSFLAPFLIAVVTGATESQRIGVTPVILLFLVGLLLMVRVTAEGRK